jgi:activator of HSP90 ATPase
MPKTLTQTITFKNQKASSLYAMFLDSKQHTMLTGGVAAKMSSKVGAKFAAHGGYIKGKNLQLVKNRLIVQSWRSRDWTANDLDSTFILAFEQKGKDVVLTMVHANIPDKQAAGIKTGWTHFYWRPWKEYLSTKY